MAEFHRAYESNSLERKHQMMSSAITLKAVLDAAKDPQIRKQSEGGGISRMDIIDWVINSQKYKKWAEQLLNKLEFKSYQANMTKALMKADFARVGSTGRHVKWKLPDDKSENDNDNDSDQEDEGDNENENSDEEEEKDEDEEDEDEEESADDNEKENDNSDKSDDDNPGDKEQIDDSDSDSDSSN